jgi:hypothetical protein
METPSVKAKIFITLFTLGIIIWLGGSIIRTIVAYDIYVPATELKVKDYYSDEIRIQTVRLFASGALYTEVAYGVAFLSAVYLIVYYRKQLKIRGWLFMSFVLFFMSSPIEFYMMYMDLNLNLGLYNNYKYTLNDDFINHFFVSRFRQLNFMAPMAYLSVFSSVWLVIFRPLDKKQI